MTLESVCDAARKLPFADRLTLMETLWDEISAAEPLSEIATEFQTELDRRIRNSEETPTAGRPWREVMTELKDGRHATTRHPS